MNDEAEAKLNILIAYPYIKPEHMRVISEHRANIRFILDSGAFTAWKAGKPIALDDYCRFLESLPVQPWRYFMLDVIGDPAATLGNYETMHKRGFKPVPIFTRGEDPSVLEAYYETSDVVGIGGLVGTQKNKGFINGIMKRVGKRRVHWLGFSDIQYVKAYRPYMCDSSSCLGGVQFGWLALYAGNGRLVVYDKKMTSQAPSKEMVQLFRKHEVPFMELSRGENWRDQNDKALRIASFRAYVMLQRDIMRNLGTRFFFALTAAAHLKSFVDADEWARSRKQ